MAKNLPPGFDPTAILQGLHQAMEFGAPTRTEDKATFVQLTSTVTGPTDADGVPFDPDTRRTTAKATFQVPCAIEFADKADQEQTFGVIQPTRIKITLLDPDYQKVKGFEYVVVGGDKYLYRLTEPPVALGSIDVWTVHCVAEDEA